MMWLHASNSTATAMYGLPWLQGKANVFGYRRLLFSYSTTNQPVSQPTPFFIVTFTKVSALVSLSKDQIGLFFFALPLGFVCLSVCLALVIIVQLT